MASDGVSDYPYLLTLDANGGTVNGASAMVVDVVELMPINNLPDAFRQGYTFAGWYIGDTKINVGSTYSFTGNHVVGIVSNMRICEGLEGNCGNQQDCCQHNTEQLFAYCFHGIFLLK